MRVPSGVLGEILHHLCMDGPLALRHILIVSRQFYYAAVNDAHLWTNISFDPRFFKHFEGRPVKQVKRFTKQCLIRSGALPLCLRITPTSDNVPLSGALQAFMNPKYKGVERCTSLTWHPSSQTTIQKTVALLPKEFPSLKHMSLSHFDDPTNGSQCPNCPLLERVEIFNHWGPYPPFWGSKFAHVTTLSFGNTDRWAPFDLITLSLFPSLHDLTLFTLMGIEELVYHFDSQPQIQLRDLQVLRVGGCTPSEILARVVAPVLKELHIKANAEDLTSIVPLWKSFEPSCLCLHVLLPESIAAQEPEWATDLSKLVKKCTRLETLYISNWMEEEFKKCKSSSNVALHVL